MARTRKRKNQQNANGGNNNQSGNDQSGNHQNDKSDDEGKTGNLLARRMRRFIEANPSLKFV
jgi:hypothetical protein